ncbi:MAG: NADP-dependent oxidoreductase [Alphaproteobacteria bacterium]|nr:NADP-dependent oxidoreductase [Alphaproteobacteria bacterium]
MKQVVLRHAIDHKPRAADFELIEAERPDCPDSGVLVKLSHISMDPYVGSRLRGRHMGEAPPQAGVEAIPGHGVGEVVESRSETHAVGDVAYVMEAGWREFAAVPADGARKIDPEGLDRSVFLSSLGMPGLTAWAGMTQLAGVGEGDMVLVDAAAGAVGGCVGQIARARGAAEVYGIAGGAEKCALVERSYGFDACFDYKAEGWADQLAARVAGRLSVHFENVSTDMLTLALSNFKPYGRAVLCGLAAQYHADAPPAGIPTGLIIGKRAKLHGLVVYDFYDRWDRFMDEVAPLVRSGALTIAEDRAEGLEAAPAVFERLMDGANVGKALVAL